MSSSHLHLILLLHFVVPIRFTLSTYLQVPLLRPDPLLDEVLGIVAEAQHEVSLCLQLVNRLNGLMDLHVREKGRDSQGCTHLAI